MDEKIMNAHNLADSYRREMVGRLYRHFKGGIYVVSEIAMDCETLELVVIYKDCGNSLTWVRTFDDFISEVDNKKYPGVRQRMRFQPLAN